MSESEYTQIYRRYLLGFGGGLALVFTAYFAVTNAWLAGMALAGALLLIALVQFVVQMVVFLHVLDEKKPRWTLWSIGYTVVMLLIIVLASLWIMANMNYNMHMTPEQMQEFMLEQNKKGF